MSEFLTILKAKLSDKKYGWAEGFLTFPDEKALKEMMRYPLLCQKGQVAISDMPLPPRPLILDYEENELFYKK